ncbi:hypothetical protein HanRHA438_Chr04g0170411 [Helianthus annuus]|uniref:Uncharacterized protein n=1 Tax=Helianthus annuus TaxID=4232 RepID=A0A251UWN2_HELAN|nr:hypothetical protein HanXRQr2_Chr04g0160221 [Helianthus annuus]KAJ0596620.1 hypothetical protein HanHA89_Chr04g0144901 [Helianthus annuus]KAJ0926380.1 hypothetical protein HanRHA438_Chr04g0170411 [Helianthus annuus]
MRVIERERERERGRGEAVMEELAVVSRRPPSWPSVRPVVGCGGLETRKDGRRRWWTRVPA